MSSCFLCDTSYTLRQPEDGYNVVYEQDHQAKYYMKYMPIMVGSSGTNTNDQQHTNGKTQNYVSYRVKKIEFRSTVYERTITVSKPFPDMIILFKIPFREIIFDYYFTLMNNFILYSEPESILDYCVCPPSKTLPANPPQTHWFPTDFNITINKPFIVGPNDYVGVLYFFGNVKQIYSSAKVWFDVV